MVIVEISNKAKYFLIKSMFFLTLLFCFENLSAQNLIPDSSFSQTDSTGGNHFWSTQISKPGCLTSSGVLITPSDTNTNPAYPISYRRAVSEDSTRMDFFWFRPLNFNYVNSYQFFSDVIFCELTTPMLKDSIYEISLWVLPPDFLSIPSIQVYISDTKVLNATEIESKNRVDLVKSDNSEIISPISSVRKATNKELGTANSKWIIQFDHKWIRVSGSYRENGQEKYFYIGNVNAFEYHAYVARVRHKKLVHSKDNNPYNCPQWAFEFFIDDVSVRKKSGAQ